VASEYEHSKTKQTPWSESASELYWRSNRRLSTKLVPTFADRGCHVVSMTDPYGRILGFLDRSLHFFFPVAPQLYSRGWVDPVPHPLLLRKSGSDGNRTRTSGSVARNLQDPNLIFLNTVTPSSESCFWWTLPFLWPFYAVLSFTVWFLIWMVPFLLRVT
jgi:hypothetical protein